MLKLSYRSERMRTLLTGLLSRLHISENTFMLILAVCIGLLAGFCNYAFRQTIEFVHHLVIGQGSELMNISFDSWTPTRVGVVLFPLIGGLLIIPLRHFFSADLSFGFAHFLEKVNLRGGKVPGRTVLTRGLASAITLGTGGSAGQEGPIAQIGGAVASSIGQTFRMSGDRLKVLVACGAAGGVAATFNAPIAGVFFAQEIVLLASFELTSFTSIVVSSAMATVVSRALLGNHPEFYAPPYLIGHYSELGLYVLLGLIIGVLAPLFTRIFFRVKDMFAALTLPPLYRPLLGGVLVGVIGIVFPQVFGNGYGFIEKVLHGDGVWYLLAALIVFKALATAITLGSGLPGGVFAPSLYLGATIGGAFGGLITTLFPNLGLSPGAYALVGMGAFLSAVTHAPMTAIFLLFEITSSYQVIVPIMLTCVIGTAISRHFKQESIETEELVRAGINLESGKEQNIMRSLRVGEVMVTEPETVPEGMTLRQFTRFVETTRHTNFPLINPRGELTGIISVQDFMGVVFERDLMDLVVIKELATTDVITVTVDDTLDRAMRKIGYRNIEQLPVVDANNLKTLVGLVSRRDMVSAYNRALMAKTLEEEA